MKKIFYIENESILRDVIKELANGFGHQAYVYDTGEDLTFYLKDIQPDLVIADLPSLGEKSQAVFDIITEVSSHSEIWTTGWEESTPQNLQDSVSRYIPKPFDAHLVLSNYLGL